MTTPAGRLMERGLDPVAATECGELLARAQEALSFAPRVTGPVASWFVPGRIEVLGKHTDYAGGRSLVCATSRGFVVAARPRADRIVRVVDVVRNELRTVLLDAEAPMPDHGWAMFVASVARRVARNFGPPLVGADIAIGSTLPPAAGLSSSSALVVACFAVLSHVNALPERPAYQASITNPLDLAGYLGCIENGQSFGALAGDRGVGTFGGSQDHTAIVASQPGSLGQFRFCPVVAEGSVAWPSDLVFVVASSGIVADKTGNALERYNGVSLAARTVLDLWRALTGRDDATLFAALTSSPDARERMRRVLSRPSHPSYSADALLARVDQFAAEALELIPAASEALRAGQLAHFGQLVDRSVQGAVDGLGNQVPETLALTKAARQLGAIAASPFGAGFGGSVWAAVPESRVDAFEAAWRSTYAEGFPEAAAHARFFTTRPGPGMLRV